MFDVLMLGNLKQITSQLADIADNAALWRAKDGNPAAIYPVPKSRLYPRIELVATQEGEGDPSPENIRQIVPSLAMGQKVKTNRTGKNLTGKNLFGAETIDTSIWSEISPGEYRNSMGMAEYTSFSLYPTVKTGVQYVLSYDAKKASEGAQEFWLVFAYADGTYSSSHTVTTTYQRFSVTSDPTKIITKIRIRSASIPAQNDAYIRNIQLELGSTATPYEPYSGADYDLLTAEQDFYGLPDAPVVVDAEAGVIRNQTGYIASYDGETVPAGWVSSTGALTTGAQVVYPLAAPEIIPITPPVINALERLKRTEARQNVLMVTANDSAASVQAQKVTYAKSPIREADDLRDLIGQIT